MPTQDANRFGDLSRPWATELLILTSGRPSLGEVKQVLASLQIVQQAVKDRLQQMALLRVSLPLAAGNLSMCALVNALNPH